MGAVRKLQDERTRRESGIQQVEEYPNVKGVWIKTVQGCEMMGGRVASPPVGARKGLISMKFGIHNPSWVYSANPGEAFEGLKAKAQWAETHGFVWFSVMDHLIQIGGVGAPDEPFMEGWTVLSALAAVTSRIRLATLASSVAFRNPAHLAKIAAGVDQIS